MGNIDFGYGSKESGNVEETTKKSINGVKGLYLFDRNALGTFFGFDAKSCDLDFYASTLGSKGQQFYENGDMEGFATKTYDNHFGQAHNYADITVAANHLMIHEDNNPFRDRFVEQLRVLGQKYNLAIAGGETAIMYTLLGMYASLTSIGINTSGTQTDLENTVLTTHDDGAGTKPVTIARAYGLKHTSSIYDAGAMNFNDILCAALCLPREWFVVNTLIVGKNYETVYPLYKNDLQKLCTELGMNLKVNNHVIMPNFKGIEYDMNVSALFDKHKLRKFNVQEGQKLIGLGATGLGSNGYTGAVSFADNNLKDEQRAEFDKKLSKPTPIFIDAFKAVEDIPIQWASHVTGGAFTKLTKIIPNNFAVYINRNHSLKPQSEFYQLKTQATNQRMYSYFNCGIQGILGVKPEHADEVIQRISKTNIKADEIGYVKKGKGQIQIESMFDNELVTFE
ncbi:MAG: AIR synthase-related protein [Candidatus Nanoarchaeia archaeon]|jgi:phosphoribosylformylglycinamidine cyclo-ligase